MQLMSRLWSTFVTLYWLSASFLVVKLWSSRVLDRRTIDLTSGMLMFSRSLSREQTARLTGMLLARQWSLTLAGFPTLPSVVILWTID